MQLALLLCCASAVALASAGHGAQGDSSAFGSWDALDALDQCDASAADCLKAVHTEGAQCIKLSYGDEFKKKCGRKIKHFARRWWHSSMRWHRVAGACINHTIEQADAEGTGDEHPVAFADILAALNEPRTADDERTANEALQMVEIELANDEPAESETDMTYAVSKDKGPYNPKAQKCWYSMKANSAKCNAEIIQKCKPLAVCIGVGPEPAKRRSAKWYNYIRALRDLNDLAAVRMQVAIRMRCGY